jgi:hypothetical protein
MGDPLSGAGVAVTAYCVPAASSPPITIATAGGNWFLHTNGYYYANTTAHCPTGYTATGGGAYCDSAGGTFTGLIYSNPIGNDGYYGSCVNVGDPYTGGGVRAYVHCVPQGSTPPISIATSHGGWQLNANGYYYADSTAQCPNGTLATGGGGMCDSAGGTFASLIYDNPVSASAFYASCVNAGNPLTGTGSSSYAYCAPQ